MSSQHHKYFTFGGTLVALGIIFGDIGTSPLYVLKAIVGKHVITEQLVFGGLSCIFWTLTLQTTFKYIFLTLQADNKGEGGIFSLYALVHRYRKWLYFPALIGAGALLGDGIITPAISVTASIEGLETFFPDIPVVPVVIFIITLLFAFQRFGTRIVGFSFGPIMMIWFTLLATLGIYRLISFPHVFLAFHPKYAIDLLVNYPGGFWLLGAVFLATTGVEALYADLGHCGRKNIRISWTFVKAALLLNYFGQGAWLLGMEGQVLNGLNPFYEMMPRWFLIFGILIAMAATIIASQALISGSFTLISEAVSLHFWPRVTIKFPTDIKGQIFIPSINWILYVGCIGTVLYFKDSTSMGAAYGFSINIAELMTSFLMMYYLLFVKKFPWWLVMVILFIFLSLEFSFLIANIVKLKTAWIFLVVVVIFIFTMYIWYRSRKITNRFLNFVSLDEHIPTLIELSNDTSISKYATHLIYLTKADYRHDIEQPIIYSIFSHNPKRADIYWFVHIDRVDEPFTMDYTVEEIVNDKIIRIDFKLGFRIQPRIHKLFKKVIEEMVAAKELDFKSRYESLNKYDIHADFRFVVLERFLSIENELSVKEEFILNTYFGIRQLGQSDKKAFGLDASDVAIEKIPLVISPLANFKLTRRELK